MTILLEAKNEFDKVIKRNENFELTDAASKDVVKIVREDPRLSYAVDNTVGCGNQSMKVGLVVGIIASLAGLYLGYAFFGRR